MACLKGGANMIRGVVDEEGCCVADVVGAMRRIRHHAHHMHHRRITVEVM